MRMYIDNRDDFYNIELSDEEIEEYVEELQSLEHLEEKVNISLFKNKFAIFNYIKVVELIGYPKNKVFIDDLMKGLQDANWPFFNELLKLFKKSYPKELIITKIDSYLLIADEEEDYMWISGLAILIDYLGLDSECFKNKRILEKRDF